METPFSIMCFSWNADGLRLCETMSQSKADAARKGFKAFISMKQQCISPDFFEGIRSIIREKRPGLVVMVTEDEDKSDTYFHSDLLASAMPEIGYGLLKRDKLQGVGEAASKVKLVNVPSGKPSGSALRISIYATNEMLPDFKGEEKTIKKFFSNNGQVSSKCTAGDRISGAIASYVWHPRYGKFVFIAANLPSGADALKLGKGLDYNTYRSAIKSANNICLISLFNKFVDGLTTESKPDHVFLLGDLNYDVVVPNKDSLDVIKDLVDNLSAQKIRDLQQYDELTKDKPEILRDFKEGVGGNGPLFMPTWKLERSRPKECSPNENTQKIDITCFEHPKGSIGGIGWHDRILYKENISSNNYMAHCLSYNRIDINNMNSSSHAGVIGFFEMRPIE